MRFRDTMRSWVRSWAMAWLGLDLVLLHGSESARASGIRHRELCDVADLQREQQAGRDAVVLERLERLAELLEPQVKRERVGRVSLSPDWDVVQEENLKQFEENNDGKPFRR